MYRIMLVDDEPNILNALNRLFKREKDFEIEIFESAKEAIKRAQVTVFDLFLSDYRMPEMNGVKFLSEIRALQSESMRLILSGHTDLDALLGAINQAQIYRFVTKPWNDYDLISTVRSALEYRNILVENRRLADTVRDQAEELNKRKTALEKFQKAHPTLVAINWAEDGSIVLDDQLIRK